MSKLSGMMWFETWDFLARDTRYNTELTSLSFEAQKDSISRGSLYHEARCWLRWSSGVVETSAVSSQGDRSSALASFSNDCQSFFYFSLGLFLGLYWSQTEKTFEGRFVFWSTGWFHSVAVERVCIFLELYFSSFVCFQCTLKSSRHNVCSFLCVASVFPASAVGESLEELCSLLFCLSHLDMGEGQRPFMLAWFASTTVVCSPAWFVSKGTSSEGTTSFQPGAEMVVGGGGGARGDGRISRRGGRTRGGEREAHTKW
jgi:hypothetical protein